MNIPAADFISKVESSRTITILLQTMYNTHPISHPQGKIGSKYHVNRCDHINTLRYRKDEYHIRCAMFLVFHSTNITSFLFTLHLGLFLKM